MSLTDTTHTNATAALPAPSFKRLSALTLATLAFAVALRLPQHVWLATSVAGVISAAAAIYALERRFFRIWRGSWVLGVLGGLALASATYIAYPPLSTAIPALSEEVRALYATLSTPPGPRIAAPLLFGVVVVEEIVWRGLAVEMLERRLRTPLGVGVAATLLYALPQVASGSWVLVLLALGCGALWTGLRLMTGGLLAPLFCHAVWNGCVFIAWPIA